MPTHFPIVYSPLIILVILLPNIYTISIVTVIYVHLFVDSFCTSDGIKWLYPFNKKYYGFLNDKTKGKHGILWQNEYMTTPLYKIEFVLLVATCSIMWLNHIFYYKAPTWGVALLGGLVICFLIGAFLVERVHVKYVKAKAIEEKAEIQ